MVDLLRSASSNNALSPTISISYEFARNDILSFVILHDFSAHPPTIFIFPWLEGIHAVYSDSINMGTTPIEKRITERLDIYYFSEAILNVVTRHQAFSIRVFRRLQDRSTFTDV